MGQQFCLSSFFLLWMSQYIIDTSFSGSRHVTRCILHISWHMLTWIIKCLLQAYKLKTLSVHDNAVEAPCEYFGECGGCKTQNLSYEAQLEAKEQQVHDLIARMGKFGKSPPVGESGSYMMPIVPCPTPYGYRNKVCCGTSSCFHFTHKPYNYKDVFGQNLAS